MSTSTSLIRRARVRRNIKQWRDIIHRFEQSGQTRDAFCAEQSLALSTFSRYCLMSKANNGTLAFCLNLYGCLLGMHHQLFRHELAAV